LSSKSGEFRSREWKAVGVHRWELTAGLKVAGFWPPPEGSPIPGHFAMIILLDGASGAPLAFMDGNLITPLRTGAAGAVAAKYLARPESSRVGVIGAGGQGRIQTRALGVSFQDLVTAKLAHDRAAETGLGIEFALE